MIIEPMQLGLRLTARTILGKRVRVAKIGIERLPERGPFILAVKHYHHLYDGAVLYASIARPLHVFVALDWVPDCTARFGMELLCKTAGWPVGLRTASLTRPYRAYRPSEQLPYMRRALKESCTYLRRGRGLVIFPEGEPEVDPHRLQASQVTLGAGICSIVELAQRGMMQVPIYPVGLRYDRVGAVYEVELRIGHPVMHAGRGDRPTTVRAVADGITSLSR